MEKEKFLIAEYQELSRFINTGWTISYTVLTSGVIFYVALFQIERHLRCFSRLRFLAMVEYIS